MGLCLQKFTWALLLLPLVLPLPSFSLAPTVALTPTGIRLAQRGTTLKERIKDFAYWLDLCQLQAEGGDFEAALMACERAVTLKPKRPSGWSLYSYVQLQLKKYPEAIAAADRALRFQPQSSLALTYKCIGQAALGQTDTALDTCTTALKLDRNWERQSPALAWFSRGQILAQQQEIEQAVVAYDRAILLEPQASQFLVYRCAALVELGQFAAAIASCRGALAGNGQWGNRSAAWAWELQGAAHQGLSQLSAAIAAYDQSLNLNPKNALTWAAQGLIFQSLEQLPEALTAYDQAIALQATYALALVGRCSILNQQRQFEAALAACDAALKGDDRWGPVGVAQAWDQRSTALAGLGRHAEALAAATRAVGLKPDYAIAWSNRSSVLWHLQQYREGLNSTTRALGLNPDYPAAWFNRATLLRSLGDNPGAIAAYDQVLKLEPTHTRAWANRSAVQWHLGQYQAALASADRVIQITPDLFVGWYNRALALLSLKQYAPALEAYEQAIKLDPKSADALTGKGVAQFHLQQLPAAIATLEAALQLNPNQTLAQATLVTAQKMQQQQIQQQQQAQPAQPAPKSQIRGQ